MLFSLSRDSVTLFLPASLGVGSTLTPLFALPVQKIDSSITISVLRYETVYLSKTASTILEMATARNVIRGISLPITNVN